MTEQELIDLTYVMETANPIHLSDYERVMRKKIKDLETLAINDREIIRTHKSIRKTQDEKIKELEADLQKYIIDHGSLLVEVHELRKKLAGGQNE